MSRRGTTRCVAIVAWVALMLDGCSVLIDTDAYRGNGAEVGVDVGQDAAPDTAVDAGEDVGVDACPGAMVRCNGICVDTNSDPTNCGTCGVACLTGVGVNSQCVNAECRLDVDTSQSLVFSRSAPNPYLAAWPDGTILASNGSAAALIDTSVDHLTSTFPTQPGTQRPSIYAPVTGTPLAIAHWGSFEAFNQAGTSVWVNGIHGCCGGFSFGFTIDTAMNLLLVWHPVTTIDVVSGNTIAYVPTYQPTVFSYLTPSSLWEVTPDGFRRRSRADFSELASITLTLPQGTTMGGDATLTADGGILAHSVDGDVVGKAATSGAFWQVPYDQPTAAVLLGNGNAVFGALKAGLPYLIAVDVANGSEVWSVPLPDVLNDVVVGDGGTLYVAVQNSSTVLGLSARDGSSLHSFRNVPFPLELMLRQGILYASGGGKVHAFAVPSQGYEPTSVWPTRHHDNQRTNSTTNPTNQ